MLQEDYKDLLDKAPIALFMQKNNKITYVNEALVKLVGETKEDLLGTDFKEYVDKKNLELARKQLGRTDSEQDIRIRNKKNKKSHYVNIKRVNIKLAKSSFELLMVIDVTERKNIEKAQQEIMNKNALGQKLELVGMLSGRVAHDFNNLLAGINGSAELIEYNLPEESSVRKYTEIITKACKSAAYLTNELLIFTKNRDSVFKVIDINLVTESCVKLLKNSINNYKSIQIETELLAEKPQIFGNEELFQNMVINLGLNAKDALQENGKILITTRNVNLTSKELRNTILKAKAGDYVEFSIEDNGTGMSKEVQKHIFQPFYTTKSKDEGTGLGMLAIYNIVKEHKGTIKIESVVNRGTKFSIYFPMTNAIVEKDDEKMKVLQKTDAKVLVVDDEPVLLGLLKDILEHMGAQVLTAKSYAEAVTCFQENQDVDLAMLDVIMPDKSGLDVYEEFVKTRPEMKVIFVTGYSKDKNITALVSKNETLDIIGKPYNIYEISDKILNLLAKK